MELADSHNKAIAEFNLFSAGQNLRYHYKSFFSFSMQINHSEYCRTREFLFPALH